MSRSKRSGVSHHQDRLIRERVHDIGDTDAKLTGSAICPDCGVLYDNGRWQWPTAPHSVTHEAVCPACQRIRDNKPAGMLILGGPYFTAHREEIMHLVQNKVDEQSAEHPLKRIMRINTSQPEQVAVTFTDQHSPWGVGQALRHAHRGTLDVRHSDDLDILIAEWQR